MPLRFYMDEHVNRAITSGLIRAGVDVLTVQADGRAGRPDPELLNRAAELERVIFTQDEDFLAEGTARQRSGQRFAGIIYSHQRYGPGVGGCVEDLLLMAELLDHDDMVDRIAYLPMR